MLLTQHIMLPGLYLKDPRVEVVGPNYMASRATKMRLSKQVLTEAKVSGIPSNNLGKFIAGYSTDVAKDYVIICDRFSGRLYSMMQFQRLDAINMMGRIQIDGQSYIEDEAEVHVYHP
jgi:hypothetical protein